VPVVAAVEGNAAAGGFELLQAVDIAVVRDDARLADVHLRFGQIPGGGSTQRLPRLLGQARAMGLILTGERISGRQAQEWGLVYRSVPPETFERELAALVDRLASGSAEALAASKRLVRDADRRPLEEGLDAELEAVLDQLTGPGGDAAVDAFTTRRERS
jgi:enoyl-CoA hydratase/carnithine racemase